MSIINEAIKKARKEFEIGKKDAVRDVATKEEKISSPISKFPRRKWKVFLIGVSLAFFVSISGSLFLYQYMSKSNVPYTPPIPTVEKDAQPTPPPVTISEEPQKAVFPAVEFGDIAKLSGIVYGEEEKWAIINDKIVREGDPLLDGKLTLIAKDFVRIERDNGEEIILNLR